MMDVPLFALVDCNNFYASCERVFNPKLRGVPIIVLSNNDGCVIARSNEAKELGIQMGEPFFKCKPTVDRHGVSVFSSNFALYGDMSRRVMTVLEQFSPRMEIYSIDEAFLRLDGTTTPLNQYGREIQEKICKWTGIPVSIGIAPTKTLAKAANRIVKKSSKFCGVLEMVDDKEIESVLVNIPVEDVWGIGRQYAQLLQYRGIKNALQLRNADLKWIRKRMTVIGERLVMELRGVSCIPLEQIAPAKKSIVCSRSFSSKMTKKSDLEEALSSFAARAAEKLRKQDSVAGRIEIFIQTSQFFGNFHADSAGMNLPHTSDTRLFIRAVQQLLNRIYLPGFDYKKAGVTLFNIAPKDNAQGELFSPLAIPERPLLMKALDRINQDWGRGTITLAAEGLRKSWQMNRNHISKRFTTRWDEVVRVFA